MQARAVPASPSLRRCALSSSCSRRLMRARARRGLTHHRRGKPRGVRLPLPPVERNRPMVLKLFESEPDRPKAVRTPEARWTEKLIKRGGGFTPVSVYFLANYHRLLPEL